jgi:hypothetical protein
MLPLYHSAEIISKASLNDFLVRLREAGTKASAANSFIRRIYSFCRQRDENNHTGEHLQNKAVEIGKDRHQSPLRGGA